MATHTEYKTLEPVWHRVFELQVFDFREFNIHCPGKDIYVDELYENVNYFKVKDVHGILYITVYDEDKNHKSEFLGKIAVPLLKMEVRLVSASITYIHWGWDGIHCGDWCLQPCGGEWWSW